MISKDSVGHREIMYRRDERSEETIHPVLGNRVVQVITLTLLVLLLYGRVLDFDFIGFDDTFFIVDNQEFLQDLRNIPEAFRRDVFHAAGEKSSRTYYRPLLLLSFMIDAQFGKTDPAFYHGTNVVLHLLASYLVLVFLTAAGVEKTGAFLLALVFAAHPMLSQAVGWIPGRNDSLLTLFVLSSLIALFRYVRQANPVALFGHFFFFALALLTKESAIALPLLALFAINFLVEKKPSLTKQRSIVITYAVIGLLWFLLRKSALIGQKSDLSFITVVGNFLGNLPLLFQYLSKIIFPYRLSTYSSPEDTNVLLCLLSILLLLTGVMLNRVRKGKIILFGILWFLLFLSPSLIVPKITGLEHRIYLPLVGILLLVSETRLFKQEKHPGPFAGPILIYITLLIAINLSHTASFRSPLLFWQKAVEASPNASLAYMNYGAALEQTGQSKRAIEILKAGIDVNPEEPMIHYNLAVVYFRLKIYREAEREVREEIRVNPRYSDAYFLAGAIRKRQGDLTGAIRMWEKTLSINPNHSAARKALLRYGH